MSLTNAPCSSHEDGTDDTWQDEDEETRQDFDEFKIWLEQQGDPPKIVSPRKNKVPQEAPKACALCKKDLGDCILPEFGLITFQKNNDLGKSCFAQNRKSCFQIPSSCQMLKS